jgi:hypothetical protein
MLDISVTLKPGEPPLIVPLSLSHHIFTSSHHGLSACHGPWRRGALNDTAVLDE